MTADGIVGNTDGHPYGTLFRHFAVAAAAHHLKNPGLIGVADGEGFTLTGIAVLLYQRCHDIDSLTGILGTLEGDVDE